MRYAFFIGLLFIVGCVGRTNETVVVQDKIIPCITSPADKTCSDRQPASIAEYKEDLAGCRAEVGYWRKAWANPKWCRRGK